MVCLSSKDIVVNMMMRQQIGLTQSSFSQLPPVRLDNKEREQLVQLFKQHLQGYHDATVYLFGSRTRMGKKGGIWIY